jgi:hypothetical protein
MDQFFWRLLQLSIVGGAVWANAEYQVTPNPYLAGIGGIIAAAFATSLLSQGWDGLRWLLRTFRRHKGLDQTEVSCRGADAERPKHLPIIR